MRTRDTELAQLKNEFLRRIFQTEKDEVGVVVLGRDAAWTRK